MNKNLIILVIIIALIVLGSWAWAPSSQKSAPATSPTTEDTTAAITDDLSGIEVTSSDADFGALDTDLQAL